jgi:WD repeat-containing protein 19
MVKEDFSACPKCDFPALHSEFMRFLETEVNCPMCTQTIARSDVKKIVDIDKHLNATADEASSDNKPDSASSKSSKTPKTSRDNL